MPRASKYRIIPENNGSDPGRGENAMVAAAKTPPAETSASTSGFGLIAPDTSGMNFYRADPVLADLLRIHLPAA
ncbi:MAG: hypothetical protein ACJAVZ_004856, partial [Afipia broomeae]